MPALRKADNFNDKPFNESTGKKEALSVESSHSRETRARHGAAYLFVTTNDALMCSPVGTLGLKAGVPVAFVKTIRLVRPASREGLITDREASLDWSMSAPSRNNMLVRHGFTHTALVV